MPTAKQPTVTKPYTPVNAGPDPPTHSKVIHAGLISRGNTCYANSILQALTGIPSFWLHCASESSLVSPLLKSVMLSMSMLSQSSTAVDPSAFLKALQREMSSIRKTPFDINTQQDVPEILLHVLGELAGPSVVANNIITNIITTTTSCMHASYQLAGRKPENLSGNDRWLCPQCSSYQDSTIELVFTQCGDILIIQLKRCTFLDGRTLKNNKFVPCLASNDGIFRIRSRPTDDISFNNKYSLAATIIHSGILGAGHYWAFIKDRSCGSWSRCDDKAVVTVAPSDLNNCSSIHKKHSKGVRLCLVFGCDDPTFYPRPRVDFSVNLVVQTILAVLVLLAGKLAGKENGK
ncbi:ubiquitin carboxyl-terminal hydrolase 51-like [Hydractinia symbiolongicarpus]|uniref:ubiquitin carboxyl-terminal hydrolase 51-like n=1 Tax=Hydractinia symbiolongicarpus TaxID=13093 RepID=UPI00254FAB3B|nr:ubiquitin carboxyl-terminal hydrolase 51-like [Hydractinia symbiolongicarpus]